MTHTYLTGALVLFLSFVTLGSSGCSGGFLSTPYENTVAYFNTFYNAKKSYNDAVEEIRKAQPKTFQPNMFVLPTVPQNARNKLLSVIEKCSKVIQFYPHSGLVDDALFLIGRSYSMMNEILPARKKFLELLENFPGSEYRFETKLGLAKSEYTGQRELEALNAAKDVVAEAMAEEEWDIAAEALLLEGQVFQDRREYPQAIDAYTQALAIRAADGLLARAAFERAKCYEAKGDIGVASSSYHKVLDFDPDFVLEYQARLKAAVTLAATGSYVDALAILQDLQSLQLTPEDRSRVELEIGNTYRMMGDYAKAFGHYHLVDSLYKRTDASAQSYYQRGLIHEYNLVDYQLAKQFYDKAKTEFPQAEITRPAARKAEILSRYLSYRSEFAKYDSLLHIAFSPRSGQPVDSAGKSSDTTHSGGLEHGGAGSLKVSEAQRKDSVAQPVATALLDSFWDKRAASQYALGVLFFVDLDNEDSASFWLNSLLRDRPESRYAPQSLYVLAELYRAAGKPVDSLHAILLARYPDSEYALNIAGGPRDRPAAGDSLETLYAMAVRALDSGDLKYALQQFKQIVRRKDRSQLSVKAKYTVGWIYENIVPNKDSAIVYYRGLVADQPGSVFAQRVRPKLAFLDGKETPKVQPASTDSVQRTPVTPEQKKDKQSGSEGKETSPKDAPPEVTKPSSEENKDDPK